MSRHVLPCLATRLDGFHSALRGVPTVPKQTQRLGGAELSRTQEGPTIRTVTYSNLLAMASTLVAMAMY